jgi:hypothetical protein
MKKAIRTPDFKHLALSAPPEFKGSLLAPCGATQGIFARDPLRVTCPNCLAKA